MKGQIKYFIALVFITIIIGCRGTETRRTTGEYIDDAAITARVESAFVADPIVSALDIDVGTNNGVVQLSGFVDSAEQARRAEDIAENIEGVEAVENDIIVR
ncbi:MAG: BON domain-containing protein [wastewater metagenome]|nr:BON domain-containing protein [Candidatus Loosdrechtia aerotolerans]